MAKPIMAPRVVRGNLLFQVADVQFLDLTQALCAASAVHALQAQRTAQIRRQKRLATAAQS